ncbi:MAG: hypothetical protein ACYTGX_03485 [Planctomycetota bacterium]|jgi:hypothetical protein
MGLSTSSARKLVLGAGALVLSLMGFVPDADADPDGTDGVALKTAIERHYIAKVERLLAPSFTTAPAVSVDVELDLKRVQTTTSSDQAGARTVETVVATPGAVVRKTITVALPMDELPAGMGLETFRQLITSGCGVGSKDRLELLPLTVKPAPRAAAQGAAATVPERGGWEEVAPLLGIGTHVLWAVVALIVALLGWSVLRQIADRPPADPALAAHLAAPAPAAPAPQPVVVNVPVPQPAPAARPERLQRPPQPKPAPAKAGKGAPKGKPLRTSRDPLDDVQKRVAADPVRAAEALAGWITA